VNIRRKLYRKRRDQPDYQAFLENAPPVPQIADLVRTRVECKFVDGVEFLAAKLYDLASEMNMSPFRTREGLLQGYFAQHVTFQSEVFFRFGGGHEPTRVTCEIQLATDLSTRIWEAAHPVYEVSRELMEAPAEWQWNPQDPRFVSSQLGHMIHLADGLLVQLREAVRTGRRSGGSA